MQGGKLIYAVFVKRKLQWGGWAWYDKVTIRKGGKNMKKKWLIAAACVFALVLTACGSEGETINTPTETTEPAPKLWEVNVLRSDEIPEGPVSGRDYLVFGSGYQRKHIQSVTFLDTLADAPEDAWDVSEAENGAVMAWVKRDEDLYDLFIGAEGGVWANASCDGLFDGYNNMEWIAFGKAFNTSNTRNMRDMFSGCSSLTVLDLSEFSTGNVRDMRDMFCGCSSLTALDLSRFRTDNVQDMSGMFWNCNLLSFLNLSSFNTASVQDMSDMFRNCENLEELNLHSFDTKNVQNMCNMFFGCSTLRALDLSSFDTQKVETMSQMFAYCLDLTELNVSSFDTRNVWDMGGMFGKCLNLTELDLSSFNVSSVENTYRMFAQCPAGDAWAHLEN